MSTLRDYAWLSALLGVTEATVRTWVHRGSVPHIRVSERVVRFEEDEIMAWLASCKRGKTTAA